MGKSKTNTFIVILKRIIWQRLYGEFHRYICSADEYEWVFFVLSLFCFYSTFKSVDFIFKNQDFEFLLKNVLTPDLNFYMTRIVKIWVSGALFNRNTNRPNQHSFHHCFSSRWHQSTASVAILLLSSFSCFLYSIEILSLPVFA